MSDEHAAGGVYFALERPQIVAIDASPRGLKHKDHEFWRVSVDRDDSEAPLSHVVIATLHISRDEGQASVTMGGTLTEVVDLSAEIETNFHELVASSTALDAMYSTIRTTMRAICAIADIELDVPHVSPDIEISAFDPDDDDNPDDDDDDAQTSIAALGSAK